MDRMDRCSAIDLFDGQWMMIVCHGLKVHIVMYIYNDDEILWPRMHRDCMWRGVEWWQSRRECTDLMYSPSFDSAQAEQQTSLNKRRR
jgi:hypothetical protein